MSPDTEEIAIDKAKVKEIDIKKTLEDKLGLGMLFLSHTSCIVAGVLEAAGLNVPFGYFWGANIIGTAASNILVDDRFKERPFKAYTSKNPIKIVKGAIGGTIAAPIEYALGYAIGYSSRWIADNIFY